MKEMGCGIQMKAANTMNKQQQPDCYAQFLGGTDDILILYHESPSPHKML